MGNLSRKAALGIAALLTAATAATAIAGVAGAIPATTMAPASRAVSVALAAQAAPMAPAAPKAPAVAASANWPSHLYWPLVRHGDRSVKVVNIQCLLRQWLGVRLPCNTRFTRDTERDVQVFQRKHGLNPSGEVGRQTWPRLIIEVGYGSSYHLAVLAAQASLRMAYRYPITIDGIFGPRTLWAVKDFQRKYGLKPDGMVGLRTWNKMARFEW
jgi:peptidoglycan hydrolase-like protein with peptidoglycan-binding domain